MNWDDYVKKYPAIADVDIIDVIRRHPKVLDAFVRNFCSPPRTFPDIWASRNVQLDSDVAEFYDPQASPYFIEPLRAISITHSRKSALLRRPEPGKQR